MVPLWFVPVAVACGNAVIIKPSEKDPSATLAIADLWREAGPVSYTHLDAYKRQQEPRPLTPRLADTGTADTPLSGTGTVDRADPRRGWAGGLSAADGQYFARAAYLPVTS